MIAAQHEPYFWQTTQRDDVLFNELNEIFEKIKVEAKVHIFLYS